MTTHDILALIWRDSLISSIAICVVLALRLPTRRLLGAQAAYLLWVLVPCAVLAAMLPAPEHPLTAALQIAPAVFAVTPTIDLAAVPATPTFDAQPWLLAGWIAGAMSLLFVLIWQQRRYLRSLGDLVAADDGALRAQGQGGSPALVGALRPRIVLPHDFDTRFDARERELVLAHERAHLLRGDAQVNALIALLRCLNWFNPLFHFAASRVRLDQELACDALVISRFPEARRPYADAMLKAQLVGEARQELRLPAGCYWPSTHPLKERIAMLKSPILSVRRRVVASAAIAMLALGAGYASWAAQPGNPRDAWAQATVTGLPAANADARIGARIVLAVDGEPVIDTLNVDAASKQLQNGWRFEMSGDELLVSGSSAHQSTTVVIRGDRPLSIAATRGNEKWQLEGVARPIGDGTIDFNATIQHNGAAFSQPHIVMFNGAAATIESGEKSADGRFKGIRIELTLREFAREEPQVSDKPNADLPLSAKDAPPTENIAFRKMYPPKYPAEAIKNGIAGKVMVKVHIDEAGAPTAAEVVSIEPATAAVLADAAIASAMQWRYNPGMKEGKPVAGAALIPVDFALTGDDGKPVAATLPSDIRRASYRKLRPPVYPAAALASRATGTVWVRAHLNAEGAVSEAHAEQTYPLAASELADVAVDAIKGWTFNPPTLNGVAIEGDVVVPLQFVIGGYTPTETSEPVPVFPPQTPLLATITITGPRSCGNKDCPPPPPPPAAAQSPKPSLPPQPINAASTTPTVFDIFPSEEHC